MGNQWPEIAAVEELFDARRFAVEDISDPEHPNELWQVTDRSPGQRRWTVIRAGYTYSAINAAITSQLRARLGRHAPQARLVPGSVDWVLLEDPASAPGVGRVLGRGIDVLREDFEQLRRLDALARDERTQPAAEHYCESENACGCVLGWSDPWHYRRLDAFSQIRRPGPGRIPRRQADGVTS